MLIIPPLCCQLKCYSCYSKINLGPLINTRGKFKSEKSLCWSLYVFQPQRRLHYHVTLPTRISLTLSRHRSPSSIALGRSSCISTELSYIGSSWLSYLCSSIWRGPQKYIAYKSVLTSSAVSRMSGSSNFDSFRDGWSVAIQLPFCWVLPPGLVQYSSQHSWMIAFKLFLNVFS